MSNIVKEQKMKTEQYINELIKREKQMEPNPFLSTRVMAAIENSQKEESHKLGLKRVPLWQAVLVTMSLVAVAFLGVTIGKTYIDNTSPKMVMNINDSQIENLGYYNFADYE